VALVHSQRRKRFPTRTPLILDGSVCQTNIIRTGIVLTAMAPRHPDDVLESDAA